MDGKGASLWPLFHPAHPLTLTGPTSAETADVYLAMDTHESFFGSGPPLPQDGDYIWTKSLMALPLISEVLMVLAYSLIFFTLVCFLLKRKNLKLRWLLAGFAVFVLAFGTAQLLEIWNARHATYWFPGTVQAITALASVAAAMLLVKLVPQALWLPSASILRATIVELEQEIDRLERRARERTEQLAVAREESEAAMAKRWQAELISLHTRQLLQTISDNLPAAICVKDLDGRYLLANSRYLEWFHLGADGLVGKTDHDLFPGETAKVLRAVDQRVTDSGQSLTMEEAVPHGDGPRTCVTVKCPLRNQAGKPYAVFGITTDITERKQMELDSVQLAAIVKSSDDAIIGKTLDGIITSWNAGVEKIFGYAAAEMIGSLILRLIPAERQAEEHQILGQIRRGESVQHFETVRQTRAGKLIDVSVTTSPIKDSTGRIVGASKVARDITESKRAEQLLKNSFKEIDDLKAALDEHAIVAITDPQGKITHVNDKFCAISRYSREELLGQDHRLINSGYHPREFFRNLWHTIAQGRVWHGEMKNKAKDGTFYWVDSTIVPFLNDQGKPRQYVAIRTDITERKEAEAEILQLNIDLEERVARRTAELEAANRELEAFSYSVSHDLRAPLRAVNGFAGIVLEDFGSQLPEEGRRHPERVRNGARQMGELIDDLLAFSRLSRQPVNRQAVNASRLVRTALEELAPQRQNRPIEMRVGELPPCQGDPVLLKQVWINLLSNAFKYTRGRDPAVVEIGCTRKNGGDVYFVRDNGTGFDMRYADKLFGVFQRLHRADEFEGTGVGLAIVQRIVHRHGGRAWAEGEVDRGATFSFTLEEGLNHE